jgi:hypothetical protein
MVGGDGEQTSRFIVIVAAQSDGRIARTTVTDVRSELATSFAGLSGVDIVDFIEQRIDERGPGYEDAADAAPSLPVAIAETDPSAPIRFPASSVDQDVVVVDAGKVFGATERSIELHWDTSDVHVGDADDFRYRASLVGRPYGGGEVAGWRPLGTLTGTAQPGEMVDLRFETTELSSGINRLELTLEVEPTASANPITRVRHLAVQPA